MISKSAVFFALTVVFAASLACAQPAAGSVPVIDVYTMGPGDELFTRFGHAAICVTDADSPAGRCYNYGTADFSTPGPLTFGIVRGTAVFWASVAPVPRMLAWYMHEDRSVYRQRLPLDEQTARALTATLHLADEKSATYYHYHHFSDNCTTRVRDLIDAATFGKLHAGATDPAFLPLRRYVYEGLAGEPLLLAISEIALGRALDAPSTRWQDMFLPAELQKEITARFGAEPETLYQRRAPLASPQSFHLRAGTFLLVGTGALLGLLVLLCAWRKRLRLGLIPASIVLGVIGELVLGLAIFSPHAELRYNEVLLLCWPSDLILPFLPTSSLHRYAAVRLGVLILCAVGSATGLFLQPLVGPLLLAAVPLCAVFWVSSAG